MPMDPHERAEYLREHFERAMERDELSERLADDARQVYPPTDDGYTVAEHTDPLDRLAFLAEYRRLGRVPR